MFNKLKRKFYSLLYSLPFSMKGGEVLMSSTTSDDDGTGVHETIGQKSVLNDLINGEVTQEVEELRYETFRSEELANEYQYIGGGQAIRREKNPDNIAKKRKKFFQFNQHQEYSLEESLLMMENKDNRLKDDWVTRNLIKMTYKNPNVKFKLENYCHKVGVDLTGEKKITRLFFIDDFFSSQNKPLTNFLKKMMYEIDNITQMGNKEMLQSYMERNEICTETESLSFTTYSATNDVPNGVDYNFSNPTFEKVYLDPEGYMVIEYSWKDFDGNVLLSEKFKSKTAEEKFANKEKRPGFELKVDINVKQEEVVVRDRDKSNIDEWLNDDNNNDIELKPDNN